MTRYVSPGATLNQTHTYTHVCGVSEWVEFNAPPDTAVGQFRGTEHVCDAALRISIKTSLAAP